MCFGDRKTSCLPTTVTTVTKVTTVTNVTTVTTITTVTTVDKKVGFSNHLILYSLFHKALGPTANRPTDHPTTRRLELLGAAKKSAKDQLA